MAQFCGSCGAEVAEGSAFCTHCGAKLTQSDPSPSQSSMVLHFGLEHGGHSVLLGEVRFTDDAGTVKYLAERESALHENYTLSENQTPLLLLKHKMALNGYAFELQAPDGSPMGRIDCHMRRGELPRYSYEDNQKSQLATLQWPGGISQFSIAGVDGRTLAYGELESSGGLVQELSALNRRKYRVEIPGGGDDSLNIVLALCVSLANSP